MRTAVEAPKSTPAGPIALERENSLRIFLEEIDRILENPKKTEPVPCAVADLEAVYQTLKHNPHLKAELEAVGAFVAAYDALVECVRARREQLP